MKWPSFSIERVPTLARRSVSGLRNPRHSGERHEQRCETEQHKGSHPLDPLVHLVHENVRLGAHSCFMSIEAECSRPSGIRRRSTVLSRMGRSPDRSRAPFPRRHSNLSPAASGEAKCPAGQRHCTEWSGATGMDRSGGAAPNRLAAAGRPDNPRVSFSGAPSAVRHGLRCLVHR